MSPPRQPLPETCEAWPRGVCWLSHLRVAQASPADASETLPRAAPNGGHRAVAGKLPGVSVASLSGDEDDGRPVTPWRWPAPSAAPRFPPCPYPSETGDRRFWAILRPVRSPKRLQTARKWPLSPWRGAKGEFRPRYLLSGPPDTPPTAPSGRVGARTGPSGRRLPPPGCGPRAPAPPP